MFLESQEQFIVDYKVAQDFLQPPFDQVQTFDFNCKCHIGGLHPVEKRVPNWNAFFESTIDGFTELGRYLRSQNKLINIINSNAFAAGEHSPFLNGDIEKGYGPLPNQVVYMIGIASFQAGSRVILNSDTTAQVQRLRIGEAYSSGIERWTRENDDYEYLELPTSRIPIANIILPEIPLKHGIIASVGPGVSVANMSAMVTYDHHPFVAHYDEWKSGSQPRILITNSPDYIIGDQIEAK